MDHSDTSTRRMVRRLLQQDVDPEEEPAAGEPSDPDEKGQSMLSP